MALFGGTSSGGLTQDQTTLLNGLLLNIKEKNGKTTGAIGDGTTHPLSEFYGSLGAAQADYPLATALTQEIDAIVIEHYIDQEEFFYIPAGTYLINFKIDPTSKTFGMFFHPNWDECKLIASGSLTDYMFHGTSCNVTTQNMHLDGDQKVFVPFRFDSSDIYMVNTYVHDFGNLDATATILGSGVLFDDPKDIYIDKYKCRNGFALGNGIFGEAPGAIRFLSLGNGVTGSQTGYAYIKDLDFDAVGSDAEELDLFQCNIDNIDGGVVINPRLRYNGNTRRCMKFHSGRWKVYGVDVRKSSDFAADSGSTGAGAKNLNCLDWSNNGVGTLQFIGGYVDASGYKVGVGNSGGQADVLVSGMHLIGSTLRVIRTNPETGSPEDSPSTGFYCVGSGGNGSGIVNSKVVNFTQPFLLQGDYGFVRNCDVIDPIETAGYIGFSTQRKGLEYSNNRIITRTSGALNTIGRVIRVENVLNARVNNNILIQDGNTTHATTFIGFTDANATGYAVGNISPAATTVTTGSSAVISKLTNAIENPTTYSIVAAGNVGTGEDDLRTVIIANGQMNAAGKGQTIKAWGTTANNANAKTIKLYLGATVIGTYSAATSVAGEWYIDAVVYATSSSAQKFVVNITENGLGNEYVNVGTAAESGTAAINVKVTGEGTSNNDILLEGIHVAPLN